jgi:hypothetical protein
MQEGLCDCLAFFLVSRIAKINATTQGPRLAGRAKVVFLKRTEFLGHRCGVGGRRGQQNLGFEIAQEQSVAEFLESATATAGHTDRARVGDRRVGFAVQVENTALQRFVHALILKCE